MDKKPGEELASTLDANPSEPIAPATEPVAPVAEPAPAPTPAPAAPAAPAPAAPVVAAPKKKKTGLIVGVTVGALAVAGGGAAAAILLLNNGSKGPDGDPSEIMSELVAEAASGELKSQNIAYSGVATLSATGMDAKLNFSGEIAGTEGKTDLDVSVNGGGIDISAKLNAIIKNSVAYLKIDGIKNILEKTGLSYMLGTSASALTDLDGNWYKLPIEISASSIADYMPQNRTTSECNIDFSAILGDHDKIAKLLKENNFIKAEKYTGSEVSKKKSDLYEIAFDNQKLEDFANKIASEYGNSRCKATTSGADINSILKENGVKLLAEFSGKSISRLYTSVDTNGAKVNVDVDLSYPSNVSIEAPSNAKSAEELGEALAPIINMFGGSFSFGGSSYGGGSYYDYDDDVEDNCYKGSISTNCINYNDDDDDDDDDYDFSSLFDNDDDDYSDLDNIDYSELSELLDSLGGSSSSSSSDMSMSELMELMEQLEKNSD